MVSVTTRSCIHNLFVDRGTKGHAINEVTRSNWYEYVFVCMSIFGARKKLFTNSASTSANENGKYFKFQSFKCAFAYVWHSIQIARSSDCELCWISIGVKLRLFYNVHTNWDQTCRKFSIKCAKLFQRVFDIGVYVYVCVYLRVSVCYYCHCCWLCIINIKRTITCCFRLALFLRVRERWVSTSK